MDAKRNWYEDAVKALNAFSDGVGTSAAEGLQEMPRPLRFEAGPSGDWMTEAQRRRCTASRYNRLRSVSGLHPHDMAVVIALHNAVMAARPNWHGDTVINPQDPLVVALTWYARSLADPLCFMAENMVGIPGSSEWFTTSDAA